MIDPRLLNDSLSKSKSKIYIEISIRYTLTNKPYIPWCFQQILLLLQPFKKIIN